MSKNKKIDVSVWIQDYVPVSDAVRMYHVSKATIFRRLAAGTIDSYLLRVGDKTHRMLSKADLDKTSKM